MHVILLWTDAHLPSMELDWTAGYALSGGFFFFFDGQWEHWIRLLPCFLFVFLICAVMGHQFNAVYYYIEHVYSVRRLKKKEQNLITNMILFP
jgi:hypothetical protein